MTDSLTLAIVALREELRAETPLRLHTHSSAGQRSTKRDIAEDDDSHKSGGSTWHSETGASYGTRVGLPFSPAFDRYLSHPDAWGLTRLGMASILEVSEACAARHPTHRRPLFQRTLCAQLLYQVGYLGQSVEDVMWSTGMSREQVEGLLHWALVHAAHWRYEHFIRMTREPGHTEPAPERKRAS